jgi:hypothetical protein
MMDAIEILFTASFWVAAIRIASPLIFATMGELICERAGVLNLGIEGIMTVGAFAGWFTVYSGGDLWTGVIVAALAGAAFGLLHGFLTVPLGLSQHVVGIGSTLLATSLTYFVYRLALPEVTSPPKIEPFQPWPIPGLSQIPVIGEALFAQTPLTYLAFLTVAVVAWALYRTPAGLALRAAGGRGAGHFRHRRAHRGGHGGQRADGGRRCVPHHVGVQLVLLRNDQRPRLDLHRAGRVRFVAAGQGADRRDPVRGVRRLPDQAAADFRRHRAVSGVPDDAVHIVDPGAGARRAARDLSEGADDPVSEG